LNCFPNRLAINFYYHETFPLADNEKLTVGGLRAMTVQKAQYKINSTTWQSCPVIRHTSSADCSTSLPFNENDVHDYALQHDLDLTFE